MVYDMPRGGFSVLRSILGDVSQKLASLLQVASEMKSFTAVQTWKNVKILGAQKSSMSRLSWLVLVDFYQVLQCTVYVGPGPGRAGNESVI